jgi:glutamate-1-semialdehyde aminotransferase
MAAALATIRELERGEVLPRLERLGSRLSDGLAQLAQAAKVEAVVLGMPQMPFLRFCYEDAHACETARTAFFATTVRRGVLLHPNHHWYISGAMTGRDIDETLAACEAGFAMVREALGE